MRSTSTTQKLCVVSLIVCASLAPRLARADGPRPAPMFLRAKTILQTNTPYDPRIAIAVDGIIVHRHGDSDESIRQALGTWRAQGFTVGRMFFSDSDATNVYWTGKWDGTPHPDEVERNEKGEVVQCAGVRPYMLPTEGWIRYLERMTMQSMEADAAAVLPEEPLAHVNTGYEEAFRELWQQRYGRPWEGEHASDEAHFLTAQLKNELYIHLEQRLARLTHGAAQHLGLDVAFVLPVHGPYSNIASHLVAPLGTSAAIDANDGYIGQVWTGPVNWALHNYDSTEKSFFTSAYALYDYFTQLAIGTDRKLWLLIDPVEDDPNHKWSEFEQWYRHCVVAAMLFPSVDSYEVMPWPDRIFLPGYSTGGGTPAPESYRIVILSVVQAMQDMPAGGQWCRAAGGATTTTNPSAEPSAALAASPATSATTTATTTSATTTTSAPSTGPTEGIGVVLGDTMMWERQSFPSLQGIYGLLLPLIHRGVPVSACVAERTGDAKYLARFHTLVVSYESWKPIDAGIDDALLDWVRRGGVLIVLGAPDDLGGADFWWRRAGFASPLHHLLAGAGVAVDSNGEKPLGKGLVIRRATSPQEFGQAEVAAGVYVPLLEKALQHAQRGEHLAQPGYFCMRRGPFVIAHAVRSPITLAGRYVDLFDAGLAVRDGIHLEPGQSGLYRDAAAAPPGKATPRVLHATHRLMRQEAGATSLRAVVRGPAGTPAVLRIDPARRTVKAAVARTNEGQSIALDMHSDGDTIRAQFPNAPQGVELEIAWQSEP